ncbi:MAG: autotransporter-associated beta strand repeat-containing protein [Lacunisphaera sp.]
MTTGTGTGVVQFNTTAVSSSPYHFTNNGTGAGTAVSVHGTVSVVNTAGVNVLDGSANDYTGGTIVHGGTLVAAVTGALPSAGSVAINGLAANGTAELSLSASQAIGSLTFGGTGAGLNSVNLLTIASGVNLTLGGNITYDATNNPAAASIQGATGTVILDAPRTFDVGDSSNAPVDLYVYAPINGAGGLVKAGNGTLSLNAANSYAGDTNVNGGVLAVANQNALGTGNLHLDGGTVRLTNGITSVPNSISFDATHGGTLAGNWTFTSAQTFGAGVTLSPGNSPGHMNFTDLTLTGGSADFEFRAATGAPGTDWDFFSLTGTLNLTGLSAGGYTLKVISLDLNNTQGGQISSLSGATSWIIASANAISGFNAANFTIDSSQFYGGGVFALTQINQDLVLNFTPVPGAFHLRAAGRGPLPQRPRRLAQAPECLIAGGANPPDEPSCLRCLHGSSGGFACTRYCTSARECSAEVEKLRAIAAGIAADARPGPG